MKTLGKKPIKKKGFIPPKKRKEQNYTLMTLVSLTFDRFVGMKQTRLKINTGIHVHARS